MKRTPLTRRTPLARGGPLERRTPLRSRPAHRARPNEPLVAVCEARIEGVCTGRAEHRHHLLLRSQGGTDHESNTVDVCSACHRHVHDNTGWAYSVGLLRHRCPGSGWLLPGSHWSNEHHCPFCRVTVPVVHDVQVRQAVHGGPVPEPTEATA